MRTLYVGLIAVMTIVLLQITCASLYEEGPVSINEKLAQEGCTSCHEFPPDSGEHDYHIVQKGKKCFECHFYTVERDTFQFETDTGTLYFFNIQKMKITEENDTIPIIISEAHITNKVDVVIRTRVQDSINRRLNPEEIVWDNSEKSCSKMTACHSPSDPAHFQLELWYGPKNGKK